MCYCHCLNSDCIAKQEQCTRQSNPAAVDLPSIKHQPSNCLFHTQLPWMHCCKQEAIETEPKPAADIKEKHSTFHCKPSTQKDNWKFHLPRPVAVPYVSTSADAVLPDLTVSRTFPRDLDGIAKQGSHFSLFPSYDNANLAHVANLLLTAHEVTLEGKVETAQCPFCQQ